MKLDEYGKEHLTEHIRQGGVELEVLQFLVNSDRHLKGCQYMVDALKESGDLMSAFRGGFHFFADSNPDTPRLQLLYRSLGAKARSSLLRGTTHLLSSAFQEIQLWMRENE